MRVLLKINGTSFLTTITDIEWFCNNTILHRPYPNSAIMILNVSEQQHNIATTTLFQYGKIDMTEFDAKFID